MSRGIELIGMLYAGRLGLGQGLRIRILILWLRCDLRLERGMEILPVVNLMQNTNHGVCGWLICGLAHRQPAHLIVHLLVCTCE